LNKGGGKSVQTLNGNCYFSYPARCRLMVGPGSVGKYESVLLNADTDVLPGSLDRGNLAGLLRVPFVAAMYKKAGRKRLNYAAAARYTGGWCPKHSSAAQLSEG
jgi:hypothetical protein